MSKKNRGKGILSITSRGRGTCPICNTERIKLLYDLVGKAGEKMKVCKRCQHKTL